MQAGFDVLGIDNRPQPEYGGTEFHQNDAIRFVRQYGKFFDAIHASPPCQAYTPLNLGTNKGKFQHMELVDVTRAVLYDTGRPWIMENVPGPHLSPDLTLCGEMFGLGVIRHRSFELGKWMTYGPQHLKHRGSPAGWNKGEKLEGPYVQVYGRGGGKGSIDSWQKAMGIDWTRSRPHLVEAIPPAYTRWIGERLMGVLDERA